MYLLPMFLLGAVSTIIRNKAQLLSTVVYSDQSNTFSTGLQTFPSNQSGTPRGFAQTLGATQGAPTSGTHVAGEFHTDSIGNIFVCRTAGTPGTWMQMGQQTGVMLPWTGTVTPTGYLMCDGGEYSRTTYSGLFAAICKGPATVTMTIATPSVITWTGHVLNNNDPVILYSTGSLPTGLAENTTYFVVNKATNTFQLANSPGAAAINTTGSQSGTHTALCMPYGNGAAGESATTFKVPDMRGRFIAGPDSVQGGTSANRLTSAGFDTLNYSRAIGRTGGSETHTMTSAELVAHTHTGTTGNESSNHTHSYNYPATAVGVDGTVNHTAVWASSYSGSNGSGTQSSNHTHSFTSASTGSTTAFTIVPPTLLTNWIIKD